MPSSKRGDAERNTAWKMVTAALERMGVAAEVDVRIEKRLPVQGGLGAGSANAAAALIGLERELGVALPGAERLRLAAEVGSDVPLFLLGGTVLGLGRGEEVYPLPDLPAMPCVVAVPTVGVSTALAFRELDARDQGAGSSEISGAGCKGASLTSGAPPDKLRELSRALAAVWTTSGSSEARVLAQPVSPGLLRKPDKAIWPRILFSRLSAPGLRTTLKKSCSRSIPPCVQPSVN